MIAIVHLPNSLHEWLPVWLALPWRYRGRRADAGESKVGKDRTHLPSRDTGTSPAKEKVWRVMLNSGSQGVDSSANTSRNRSELGRDLFGRGEEKKEKNKRRKNRNGSAVLGPQHNG